MNLRINHCDIKCMSAWISEGEVIETPKKVREIRSKRRENI